MSALSQKTVPSSLAPSDIVHLVVETFNARKLVQGGMTLKMSEERVQENAEAYQFTFPYKDYYTLAVALSGKSDINAAASYFNLSTAAIEKITASVISRFVMSNAGLRRAYSDIKQQAKEQDITLPVVWQSAVPAESKADTVATQSPKKTTSMDAKTFLEAEAKEISSPLIGAATPLSVIEAISPEIQNAVISEPQPEPEEIIPTGVNRNLNPQKILTAACRVYNKLCSSNFTLTDVEEKRQTRDIVLLRQFVFYAQSATLPVMPYSVATLGRFLKRDHTTVMHSVKVISSLVDKDDASILELIRLLNKDLKFGSLQMDRLTRKEKTRFKSWANPVPHRTDEFKQEADPAAPKPEKKKKAVVEKAEKKLVESAPQEIKPESVASAPLNIKISFAEILGATRDSFEQITKNPANSQGSEFITDIAIYATLKINPEIAYTVEQLSRNTGNTPNKVMESFSEVSSRLKSGNTTARRIIDDLATRFSVPAERAEVMRVPNTFRFNNWNDVAPAEAFAVAASEKPQQDRVASIVNSFAAKKEEFLLNQGEASMERIASNNMPLVIDATLKAFSEVRKENFSQPDFFGGLRTPELAMARCLAIYTMHRCLPSSQYTLQKISEGSGQPQPSIIKYVHMVDDLLLQHDHRTQKMLIEIGEHLPLGRHQRILLLTPDAQRFKFWEELPALTARAPQRSPESP